MTMDMPLNTFASRSSRLPLVFRISTLHCKSPTGTTTSRRNICRCLRPGPTCRLGVIWVRWRGCIVRRPTSWLIGADIQLDIWSDTFLRHDPRRRDCSSNEGMLTMLWHFLPRVDLFVQQSEPYEHVRAIMCQPLGIQLGWSGSK